MFKKISLLLKSISAIIICKSAISAPVIEATAERVEIRKSCTVNSIELANCFTTTRDFTDWVYLTRLPNAAKPLIADFGPGVFGNLTLDCYNDFSHISIRGSGRRVTTIGLRDGAVTTAIGINFNRCHNISVENLTASGTASGVE